MGWETRDASSSGLGSSEIILGTVMEKEQIWGWGEMLRPVWDMEGRLGPGDIHREHLKDSRSVGLETSQEESVGLGTELQSWDCQDRNQSQRK